MPPQVWFVTHEQHPDPRIWKFARALSEIGAQVTYFWPPDPIPPDLEGCYPVALPELPAKDVAYAATFDELDHEIVSVIFKLRQLVTTPEASATPWRDLLWQHFKNLNAHFQRIRHDKSAEGSCILFTTRDGRDYCFLVKTGQLWRIDVDLPPAEIAVRAGLARVAADPSFDLDAAFAPARGIDSSINVSRKGDRISVERPNAWESGFRYFLDLQTAALTRVELPPLHTRGADQLGRTVVDFGPFKEGIYDYSQMLGLVRWYVEARADTPPPDLIYVADLPTLPIGIVLKRHFQGSRLMVDCHEWWREQERIWNPEGEDRITTIDRAERTLYSQCDLCVTVGDELAAAMSTELSIPFQSIYTCVFDAPPPAMSAADRRTFRETRLHLPADIKVALFQGSLTEKRNLEALMRATSHFQDDQRLVVVGDGPFRNEMMRILKAEGRPDLVIFTGWVDQYALIDYTLTADLGVIPYAAYSSYYALSMPNKLAEYHACKLPILASKDLVEISRIIDTDQVGMGIDTADSDLLGRTIAELLDAPKTLDHWRANYTRQKERFTFDVFKRRMVELTRGLL